MFISTTYLLLFIGSFFAAAISGAAGFGGALLLLPLLSRTIGTTLAVPILTIAQLIGNLSRAFFGFNLLSYFKILMIVSQDDGRGVGQNSRFKYFPGMDQS